MLQDYLLLPRISFTNCTTKLLQHLKVTSSNDGSPLWQKPYFCIMKIQFLWPHGTRALFSISPHRQQQCCIVLFYALLSFCKIKVMTPSFATCHDAVTKGLQEHTASVIVKKHFLAEVHTSPASNEPSKDKASSNPNSPPFPEVCSALF
jgi:hypothetical protein